VLYELGVQVYRPEIAGDLAAERQLHDDRSAAAYDWLVAQPDRVSDGMRVLQVRCPAKGCLLCEVYRFPLPKSGERLLARSITSRGFAHVGFLNWAFSDDWSGPRVWYPAGCRCGQAKIERAWLIDLVALMRGWHHEMETLEEMRASAPEAEQRGFARRTFHPKAESWRPRPPRPDGIVTPTTRPRPRSNR
jgi:hypothetical protein